jgi:hypothetical protein
MLPEFVQFASQCEKNKSVDSRKSYQAIDRQSVTAGNSLPFSGKLS